MLTIRTDRKHDFNQNRKDYVVISSFSSFIIGMGSILDISGDYFTFSFERKSDTDKLRGDWQKIGDDMRRSYYSKIEMLNK